MPRPTFFNLAGSKRDRLVNTMRAEFAAHSFTHASVDRITQNAGISKGSFYQYFEDKLDAYIYVINQSLEQRMAMVGTNQSETSITDLLAKLIVSSPTHQKDDPLGWAIIAKAYTDNTPAVATIMGKTTGQIHDWVTQAITEGIQSGELRPELDPDAAAWLIEHTLIGLGHYLMSRFGITDEEARHAHDHFETPEVRNVVDSVVDMLTRALGTQEL